MPIEKVVERIQIKEIPVVETEERVVEVVREIPVEIVKEVPVYIKVCVRECMSVKGVSTLTARTNWQLRKFCVVAVVTRRREGRKDESETEKDRQEAECDYACECV